MRLRHREPSRAHPVFAGAGAGGAPTDPLLVRPSREESSAPDEFEPRPRRRFLFVVWAVVVIAVVGGLTLLLVLPTRAWLEQRAEIRDTEAKLAVLRAANSTLDQRVTALQTPEMIEQVARDQYNLVKPGEQAYSVLPSALPEPLPAGWPFDLLSQVVLVRAAAQTTASTATVTTPAG
jgi:cell division protein FtsB